MQASQQARGSAGRFPLNHDVVDVPPGGVLGPGVPAPVLVFDGGCPFCRHFAELSELRGGIPDLQIRDGRADHALRAELNRRGYRLANGAMVLLGDRVLHGAEAIQWICTRMNPSDRLLSLMAPLLAAKPRSRAVYPLLLLARRLALGFQGLPVDPPEPGTCQPRP
jgi:predicted DCC family thiol-disulfide oxidoreductase YuxK